MRLPFGSSVKRLSSQAICAIVLGLCCFSGVAAQEVSPPRAEVRGTVGFADFTEFGELRHTVVGGSLRLYLTRRLSIEPELLYMRRNTQDEDYVIVPHVAFDLRDPRERVVPYVIGGVGLLHHRGRFNRLTPTGIVQDTVSSNSWTANGGAGVKIYLTDRLFIAPDVRVGWEPVLRGTVSIGYTFSGRER